MDGLADFTESRVFSIFKECSLNTSNKKWMQHSIGVAVCAYKIASNIGNEFIDEKLAFRCGLLHDIGRKIPNSYMKHILYGYNLLRKEGLFKEAEVCLTHSFFLQGIEYYQGTNNLSEAENLFLDKFIRSHKNDIYDELIQLCDALAVHNCICTIEKRIVDVVMRTGFRDYTIDIWKEIYKKKSYFDSLCNKDIYDIILSGDTDLLFRAIIYKLEIN